MKTPRVLPLRILAALLSALTLHGTVQAAWQIDGTPVCQAALEQGKAVMAPDGGGGAIVVWNDQRTAIGVDVYAQRIGPAGDALWATDGLSVCSVNHAQSVGNVVSDGSGGAIVVWKDRRNGNDMNIYVQRINRDREEPRDSPPPIPPHVRITYAAVRRIQ